MNYLRRRWRENQPRVVIPEGYGAETWDLHVMRGDVLEASVHHGPNAWHALIIHPDGSYEDLGVSYNVLTTVGRDLIAAAYGNPTGKDGVLTASSSTSATPSGGGLTTDQYKGWRVFCPITNATTAPVYGNIGSNSTTVLTVDGWWVGTADTMTGSTPGSTNGYHLQPSSLFRFMGVSAEGTTPVAGDTTLASEQTTNGLARAKTVYAHTPAAATYTAQNTYSVSGTVTVHKGGLFTAANTTAAGVLGFAANLNADASVISGDSLQITATITLS